MNPTGDIVLYLVVLGWGKRSSFNVISTKAANEAQASISYTRYSMQLLYSEIYGAHTIAMYKLSCDMSIAGEVMQTLP